MYAAKAGLLAGLIDEILASDYMLPAAWADRARKVVDMKPETSPAGADEYEPKDAEDFWQSLTDQQQAWAVEAVEATGVDLALVRSTLESKIKDHRYHPQYILGMAFAHQLLESVTAAGTDALEAKAALLADTLDDVLQWRTIADATQAALDEAVKALAALRQELETWRTEAAEANWQDWKALLAAERANTAEAIRQRDAKQEAYLQEIKYADGLERERDEARAELATAIAVRDDNEAVAVERLARLALVEADAEALADALKFYGDSPYKHYHPADAPCLLCAALAAHEALKTPTPTNSALPSPPPLTPESRIS